jgi:hypothetical protein
LAFVGFVKLFRDKALLKYVVIFAGISVFLLAVPGPVDYRFSFLLFPAILPLAANGTIQLTTLVGERVPIGGGKGIVIFLTAMVFLAYAIETNWLALRFVSLPFGFTII